MSEPLCSECEEEPVENDGDICEACYADHEAQETIDLGEIYEED